MKLLISKEDVFNKLNIDLEAFLGVKGQPNNTTVVGEWLGERQDEIADYIAQYAYNGRNQAIWYFNCGRYNEPLKKAILMQVKYVRDTGSREIGGIMLGTGGATSKLSVDERLENVVSPKAVRILENAGLLYTGRYM